MKTFTIEFPEPTEPSNPVTDTARALGIHPWIIALVTLGWPAAPLVHHTDNSIGPALHPTWYIGSLPGRRDRSQSAAAGLIFAASSKHCPPAKRLPANHNFHGIMAALRSLVTLRQWWEKGGNLTSIPVPGTGASVAIPGTPISAPVPVLGVVDLGLAAALIACGFLPSPQPVTGGGHRGVGFADDPLRPGLLHHCDRIFTQCLEAMRHGRSFAEITATAVLENFPPGEHPFLYALPAILNFPGLLDRQQRTARNAVLIRQSPYNPQRRIIISNSLMEGKDPRSQQIKALAEKHLKTA